ncbi:ABC-type transport system involved in resistance to organic solvents [Candidatus Endolissoclinum faulkneri L5]|uniref:ABC-type transport system involved in resistance to organic solvents n=1 Tax=Candidatus Endolissoclinum faulkneri L5 TaxID=1401328 RepID=V9TSC7_9PROT|nr:ABC transporter permease [Candidatus Endolissoclinum faulkneri]AHC73799.1 ABC-type transport system involved in resistance to organic solvents [Candidatus Endolissoclinum faulkneri L5]
MNPLAAIGRSTITFLINIGRVVLFALSTICHCLQPPFYFRLILRQFIEIGYNSLPIVGMTTLCSGMVVALQSYTGFAKFFAEEAVATVVVISMLRELSPILTGLMVAGRVGATMAAEIGAMQVAEQIDALTTLSTNPYKYLIVPRVIASIIILPFLVLIGDITGVFGGFIIGIYKLNFNPASYIFFIVQYLEKIDVITGMIKASIFGFLITIMGCYQGFNARKGARGVGVATTNAVVTASIMILLTNYIITEIFFIN